MYIRHMELTPKRPRGAKKKADRLILGEITLDLWEAKSAVVNFWVQPSLKESFVQACQENFTIAPDVLRDFMLEYLEEHKAKKAKVAAKPAAPDSGSQA